MTLHLRPYQTDLLASLRTSLRVHRATVCQLPTGGGKTAIATEILGALGRQNLIGNFIVHRQELIDQTIATFNEFGIPHGVIAAGYGPNPMQPIQICSIDTLKSRLASGKVLRRPRLNVWDECQHVAAKGWQTVWGYFGDALNVGLTATPERLDGKGLDDQFADMVCGPTTAELIRDGWLVPYRAFVPAEPDMNKASTRMGDFDRRAAVAAMDRPTVTGDAVEHYRRFAPGRRALVFCVSIEHSQHVAAAFQAAGIAAVHVDGNCDRTLRRQAVADFRRGHLKVLTNVDLFGEGFDVPDADVAIGLRPTQSLALFLQQCGRVLRRADGKDHCLIFDHAGNIRRHGLPDDPRQWKLSGRLRGEARLPSDGECRVRKCPRCSAAFRFAAACPNCQYAFPIGGRGIEQVDGILREIDPGAVRAAQLSESQGAESLDELIAIGRRRGYRSPETWAQHKWAALQMGEFNE